MNNNTLVLVGNSDFKFLDDKPKTLEMPNNGYYCSDIKMFKRNVDDMLTP